MTFSIEWDQLYGRFAHMSVWPWSDLVSYIHRYAKPADGFRRVLELGCGAGANIPLFIKMGGDYHTIEGSPAIVQQLQHCYPDLADRIQIGDFTRQIPFAEPFDLIVDRCSLIHNTTQGIRDGLALAFEHLRPGGKFIGIDWFSSDHGSATRGDAVDEHTRNNIKQGHLADTGNVHFCNREHLVTLLTDAGFYLERLEHKQNDVFVPENNERFAWWNFVASKP